MILNISRISQFQECRQKAWNWNELGLSAHREADALMVGGATHEGIAEFLANRDPRNALAVAEEKYRERLKDQMILPEERAQVELQIELSKRLVASFCNDYQDTEMQVLWPEVEFCVPIPGTEHHCFFFHRILHPQVTSTSNSAIKCDDIRCVQPHYFRGKADAVISWKGKIWLLEHKTTSYTGNIFYDRFYLDFQPTGYLYGIGRTMGTTPHGFLLNVLKKPTKNNKDQLAVSFEREPYIRTEEDLQRFEREFIMQANDYEHAWQTKMIYMNTKSCTAWNRRCYYWDLCQRHGQPSPEEFSQRQKDYVDLKYYEILGINPPIEVRDSNLAKIPTAIEEI